MSLIDKGVHLLRSGGLVAFPTETVYGLGADAGNDEAIARVFAAKGRPTDHPLIVHLADVDQLQHWSDPLPASAAALADAFCPGPLTLLVRAAPHVSMAVTGGRKTVGLRVPAHPMAHALLAAFGGGVVAPSANRFGRVSPTSAADVVAELGSAVDLVLDGGPCDIGIESTIVDCTTSPVTVLRRGAITVEMIEVVLGQRPAEPSGPSRAPGMLESHYAPRCRVHLVRTRAEADELAKGSTGRIDILDPGPDLAAYAHGLYAWLRDADVRRLDLLIVVRPPDTALGAAINERLTKAAAPRP
jgi:L-threonylcarbamoyladenylate synthase